MLGYAAIAGATFCWASAANLGKAAFTGRMLAAGPRLDAVILSQARTTISFLILAPIMLLVGGRRSLALHWSDILRCLLLGTVGGAASNFFYYYAIDRTTVDTAIILQYTAPVLVLFYMLARRLQKPTLFRLVGVGGAVIGSTLAIGIFHGSRLRLDTLGVLAAELAAASFAFWNVYGHGLLQRLGIWQTLAYAFLGASIFWLFISPPWKLVAAGYTQSQWIFLVVFACVSLLIPYALYFLGLKHLDATRAVVTSCLEPVFTIGLAAAFLHELLDTVQILGVALVLAATVIVQLPDRSTREPLEPFVAE